MLRTSTNSGSFIARTAIVTRPTGVGAFRHRRHSCPFEAIAMHTRQSKVFKLGFAPMLPRNDVIYREWCWMKYRGQLTVFATIPCASQTFRMRSAFGALGRGHLERHASVGKPEEPKHVRLASLRCTSLCSSSETASWRCASMLHSACALCRASS
jgi:hypothetical protein